LFIKKNTKPGETFSVLEMDLSDFSVCFGVILEPLSPRSGAMLNKKFSYRHRTL